MSLEYRKCCGPPRTSQMPWSGSCQWAAARWREQDQGIWEVRGGPRDFLYSKLMCWAALDCAIALADQLGAHDRVAAWSGTRDEIRQAILERGWSE